MGYLIAPINTEKRKIDPVKEARAKEALVGRQEAVPANVAAKVAAAGAKPVTVAQPKPVQAVPAVPEKTTAQKRDEAQQLYDAYLKSDEYKKKQEDRKTYAWMVASVNGDKGYVPEQEKDQKEQELKALVDHYTALAQKEEDQRIMEADLQELESWDEADRAALETYIINRNMDFANRLNPMADAGFGTADQKAAALIQKYGLGKVRQMAESLERAKNAEITQVAEQAGREGADSGFFGAVGHNAASVGANAVGGLTGLMGYLQEHGQRTGRYATMDPNNIGNLPSAYAGGVREETAQNIAGDVYDENGNLITDGGKLRQLGAYAYQGGMSAADSLARAALGGGAAGGAALAATGSFTQALSEASAQGATPGEAALLATATAGIEYLSEKIPLDNLMDAAKTGGHGASEIIKNALMQAGIEATTEEISLIGTTLAEAAILKEKAGYRQRVNELIAGGLTAESAVRQADNELLKEAMDTAIVSALSGGLSEAGASIAGNLAHRGGDLNADGQQKNADADNPPATEKQLQEDAAPELTERDRVDQVVEETMAQLAKESPQEVKPEKTEAEKQLDQGFTEAMGLEQQKTTVPEETAVTVKSAGVSPLDKAADPENDQKMLAYQLATKIDVIRDMESVSQLTGREFGKTADNKKISDKLRDFFRAVGNKVARAGFGEVDLGEYAVGAFLSHKPINRARAVSVAAVPDVIKNGRQIDYNPNWKGRGYPSYVFAAPVDVAGSKVYVAAVVNKLPDNKFYLSEMIDSDGNYVRIEESPSGNSKNGLPMGPENQQGRNYAGPEELSKGSNPTAEAEPMPLSENIVLQHGEEVNGNVVDNGVQAEKNSDVSEEGKLDGIKGTGAAEANFSGMRQYEDLISDDNIQRSRATDARQEEILKTDPYGRQVTEFAGNAGNSEAISDRDVDTLKQMIQDGLLGHDTQSMTEVHGHAVEKIKKKGASNVRDEITRAVSNGKINEHLIAEAEVLFAQYSNRKNMQADASTMLLNLAQMATQSGRQLNMFKLMRRLTPEGQLMVVRKNVDRAVESINESRGKKKQTDVTISEELETEYMDAARDTLSDGAAVESTVALAIADGMQEDTLKAADTALAEWEKSDTPDIPWGEIRQDGPQTREPNIQTNDMNERIGQRVADSLTRQARQQERSVEDVLYSEIMRFANDKAAQGRQQQERSAQTPNLEAMRDYYRYRPFFQNAWDIARDRVEQAMFSMQDGDPRIPVIEQFLASGDEMLGVENWNPIGAMDYANPQSTVRRGAKEAATAAGIRMDNRSTQNREQVRQQMRDVLIENAQNKEAAAQRIAQIAVESMGLEGQAAENMAADVIRAFYNDLAQQSARRVAQMFGTDRKQQQKVQKSMSDRLAELYNMGAFADEQYRQAAFDIIFGEGSGITIDDQLMETFVNAAGERRDQAADAIYKFAAAQIKPTLGEQWDAWRNLAMLGNPKTHIRNMFGSAVFRPYVSAKRAVGAGIERLTLDRENRTKAVLGVSKDSRDLLAWAKADAKSKAAQDAMELSGTTGNDVRSAVEDARQILPGKLDTVRKKNMELMEGEDMIFKRTEYANTLASFLKARGYSAKDIQEGNVPAGVLEAGRSLAVKEAQKATFNDRNKFSDTMAKFRVKGSNPTAKALNAITKGIMPFTRTLANIAVRAVEYSPAGLAKGFAEIHNAIKHGEGTVADGIDHIASGLTGTGAMLLGGALAAGLIPNVRLVGKIEDEDELPEGAQEYSIQIGNDFYGISWLAPANIPLFIGANVYNALRNKEDRGELDAWDVLSGLVETGSDIVDPMLELSCVSSLVDAVENMAYEEGAGNKFLSLVTSAATSYFTQGIPTILGQAEQATETTKMTTFSNADNTVQRAVERTLGNATKRIPGVDLYQTEKRDEFGEVVSNDDGWLQRTVDAFLNPFTKSEVKDDDLTKENARLNGSRPDSVSPPATPKKITYTGSDGTQHKDHLLTEEEYSTLAAVQGQTAKGILDQVLESDVYAAMTDQQKASVFQYVYDYAREKGRTAALAGYEGLDGWMKDLEGNEAAGILDKAVKNAFTDAFDHLQSDPEAAAAALDQAYGLLDQKGITQWAKDAGGRTKYFIDAKRRGVDAATFLSMYQQFRDIDGNPVWNTSEKAAKWSYQLQKAQEAGIISKAQKDAMKDSMVYYQQFPAGTEKFDQMTEAGLSADKALDIGKLLDGIKPQAGYTDVRDVQKASALAGSSLSRSEKAAAMKIYLSDAQDENLDLMLALGYGPEDYAAVYEIYSGESGTGKKTRIISKIRSELGVDYGTAREIYEIYG